MNENNIKLKKQFVEEVFKWSKARMQEYSKLMA